MLSLILTALLQLANPIVMLEDAALVVGCAAETGVARTIGTSFPALRDAAMTAAHVRCYQDEQMFVIVSGQRHDVVKRVANMQYDMAMLHVPTAELKLFAFRDPVVGEETFGFGSPIGGIFSFGRVAQVNGFSFLATNLPPGGMSGSPMLGADGQIIGMVTTAVGDNYARLSGGYVGSILEHAIEIFPKNLFDADN